MSQFKITHLYNTASKIVFSGTSAIILSIFFQDILNKANNRQQSLGNESNTSRLQENYSGSHYAKLGRVPSRPPDSYGLYERTGDQKSREPDVIVTTANTNNWGMPYVPPLNNERGNNRSRGTDGVDQKGRFTRQLKR